MPFEKRACERCVFFGSDYELDISAACPKRKVEVRYDDTCGEFKQVPFGQLYVVIDTWGGETGMGYLETVGNLMSLGAYLK